MALRAIEVTQVQPTEHSWQLLAGINPNSSKFPARTTLDNEGIIVFRTRTGFRGVQRACPHMQATLMNAEIIGNDTMLRCPLHIFTFKLSDGKGVNCPGFRLTVYEIKHEQDALYGRRVGSSTQSSTKVGSVDC